MAFVEIIGQQPLIEVTSKEPVEVIITPGSNIRMNVIISDTGVTNVNVVASQGIQGPTGPAGANGTNGANGAPGPNTVSTSTSTNITGILAGNGTTVQEAQMNTNKLLGRSTAGVGDIEEITIGEGLSLSSGQLTATAQPTGYEQHFLLMGA